VLAAHPEYELSYIVAPPRMAFYMKYSTRIYNIYLKYIAPEDIHVYSIDEVFIDATHYLNIYRMTARQLASRMIRDIIEETGITATAGIGTNLYLCKVAMDILAKHAPPDENGVRIADLDEMSYRRQLWSHRPLTDFWRVGAGYQKKLEKVGIRTMGDIALCSTGGPNDYYNEDLLYKLFGVNAELLIDHAWGWEPTTIDLIKAYKPQSNSISSGQVLQYPYEFEKGKLIVREMTDLLVLDLVDKQLVTDQIVLTIGYDVENLTDQARSKKYHGEVTVDRYGRRVPKHAHGTANLGSSTSSTRLIVDAVMDLYDRIVDPALLIRRVTVVANHLVSETDAAGAQACEQLDLFTDYETRDKELEKERKLQEAMLSVKKKYGKNAILKGTNLQVGATTIDRNRQIGGHKA
jgi:DNA polymerase V